MRCWARQCRHPYTHISISIYIYNESDTDMCVHMCIHKYIRNYINVYIYVCVGTDVIIYLSIITCIHTFIHTQIHIYIYMCIYIDTWCVRQREFRIEASDWDFGRQGLPTSGIAQHLEPRIGCSPDSCRPKSMQALPSVSDSSCISQLLRPSSTHWLYSHNARLLGRQHSSCGR